MPTIKSVKKGLWDCRWWCDGKQHHRHIKADTKAAALKRISQIMDSLQQEKSAGANITWNNGYNIYSTAKLRGGKSPLSMEDIYLSLRNFLRHAGDKPVEQTTRLDFTGFLARMAEQSSPANANKHRRNLLAVARWLRKQGHIENIPFEHTPTIEAPKKTRRPLPRENRDDFITCLPEWLQPPIMFALATSARNSAICGLRDEDVTKEEVVLHEKRGKVRRMLRDEVIDGILGLAEKQRKLLRAQTNSVFCNSKGKTFSRNSLLKSAQYYWRKAGLGEDWTIHSLRHTFGTTAGDAGLGVDAIRAGMGHDDRSSSAGYVHTDEVTAATVRKQIYEKLSGFLSGFICKSTKYKESEGKARKLVECPNCGHKHMIEIGL